MRLIRKGLQEIKTVGAIAMAVAEAQQERITPDGVRRQDQEAGEHARFEFDGGKFALFTGAMGAQKSRPKALNSARVPAEHCAGAELNVSLHEFHAS